MSTQESLAGLARGKRQKLPYDDAPLFTKIGGRYHRLVRKHEAHQRLMDELPLDYHAANYRLLNAARTQEVRSVQAHRNAWLYVSEDVDALVQRLAHELETQD